MPDTLTDGLANPGLQHDALGWWLNAANEQGIDITSFPLVGTHRDQLAWARRTNLEVGIALSRSAARRGESSTAQIRECVDYAPGQRVFVPPLHLCVDEGTSGRQRSRKGLDRAVALLARSDVDVLLVPSASRLFQLAYRGVQFIEDQVLGRGLRAILVRDRIDTRDPKWNLFVTMQSLAREMRCLDKH